MANENKTENNQTLKELQERISNLESEVKGKDAVIEKSKKIFTVRQAEFSNSVQPDPKFK